MGVVLIIWDSSFYFLVGFLIEQVVDFK